LFSTVIDSNSEALHVKKDIQKIVAIGPGALRLLVYMNLEDKLVGIEQIEQKSIDFSEYRTALGEQKINSLPLIGAGGPGKLPNLEMLLSLNPDIIVASFIGANQLKTISQKTNIPIISLSYGQEYGGEEKKLEAIKKSLTLLGKVFDKEKRAQELIAFMTSQEKELKQYSIKEANLYIGGMGFKGSHGITSTEKNYPSFELLEIQNPLTKDAPSNHMFIQEESLILQNPQMIFLDMYGKKTIKEEINSKPSLFASLDAYRNQKIYWLLAYNFYNTNVANVYINSWIILQKLGYDIDIESKMNEIYSVFYKENVAKLMQTRYPIEKF
jgi:iron complex transport system substrate-binding protein